MYFVYAAVISRCTSQRFIGSRQVWHQSIDYGRMKCLVVFGRVVVNNSFGSECAQQPAPPRQHSSHRNNAYEIKLASFHSRSVQRTACLRVRCCPQSMPTPEERTLTEMNAFKLFYYIYSFKLSLHLNSFVHGFHKEVQASLVSLSKNFLGVHQLAFDQGTTQQVVVESMRFFYLEKIHSFRNFYIFFILRKQDSRLEQTEDSSKKYDNLLQMCRVVVNKKLPQKLERQL